MWGDWKNELFLSNTNLIIFCLEYLISDNIYTSATYLKFCYNFILSWFTYFDISEDFYNSWY